MPASKRSGTLEALSRLALGVLLGVVPSCALDDAGSLSGDEASQDTLEPEDDAADAICTQGVYRCRSRIISPRSGQWRPFAPTPTGYGPPELQSAYKINPNATLATKPTVAIVIAYGYAALESDLAVYRSFYKLPPCTIANGCLKIVNQMGQTSPLPPEPPANDDWRIETALDIDMVSAACPQCNILVVQASDNFGDDLFIGQNAAAQLGATVISNSWGGPENADTPSDEVARVERFFAHPNIGIFVAAGDNGFNDAGAGPDYPATSAHVISVGGTRLIRDASARGWSEVAWTKGGSACSLSIAKPAYQTVSPCAFKATADIAAVGDPATGVAIYNALRGGWLTVGGTSASSPFVAGVFAAAGLGSMVSGAFLSANMSKLFDVTAGNNGNCGASTLLCNAAVGWDGPSGYGTPNAAALSPPGMSEEPKEEPQEISSGCSAGGAGAGLMLGLALLGLRRRRRG